MPGFVRRTRIFGGSELVLPEGSNSVLDANGNLCDQALVMPTTLTAQNGATIEKDTRIEAGGCPSTLGVRSVRAAGGKLALRISVPGRGRLTASGHGLLSASKRSSGRETLTLLLRRRTSGQLHSVVRIVFVPSGGSSRARKVKLVDVRLR